METLYRSYAGCLKARPVLTVLVMAMVSLSLGEILLDCTSSSIKLSVLDEEKKSVVPWHTPAAGVRRNKGEKKKKDGVHISSRARQVEGCASVSLAVHSGKKKKRHQIQKWKKKLDRLPPHVLVQRDRSANTLAARLRG